MVEIYIELSKKRIIKLFLYNFYTPNVLTTQVSRFKYNLK